MVLGRPATIGVLSPLLIVGILAVSSSACSSGSIPFDANMPNVQCSETLPCPPGYSCQTGLCFIADLVVLEDRPSERDSTQRNDRPRDQASGDDPEPLEDGAPPPRDMSGDRPPPPVDLPAGECP